jgi:type IV secretion system protein VirD4
MSTAAHVIGALLRFLFAVVRALAVFAVHHRFTGLAVFLAVVAGLFFRRAVLSRSAQSRRRARALGWRARLRLRPGPGYASLAELVLRWGRLAALHHGRRMRPGMGLLARLLSPATAYAVRLGRAQYFRRVYARGEDQTLIIAPQRTGKSGIIADRLLDHPGPAIVTSTRADLYHLTAGARSQRGPVYMFNPQHVGGLPGGFSWNLLDPCADLVMARRMAAWLTGAMTGADSNLGNLEWFTSAADTALMAMLHAAAVGGYTITDVYAWCQLQGHDVPLRVLASRPGNELLVGALRRVTETNRTAASIRESMSLSLAWATIPQMAAAATPQGRKGFNLAEFIAENGTLYLIAAGDEDSPVAPLFAAFTSWCVQESGLIGSTAPAGKLDPPLWLGLDEVTQICPLALPLLLADSAGKGVAITAVAHGTSQLADRWGEHGMKTVWACSGTKVILGGISDAGTLEEVSELCGTIVIGEDDSKTVRVAPPELIRALPDWRALVLRMNLNPVIVKFRPAWKRLGFRFGRRVPVYIPRQLSAQLPAREPVPAELEPALSEADLARFFDQDARQADPAPSAFPLPSGPDPRAFKRGEPSS